MHEAKTKIMIMARVRYLPTLVVDMFRYLLRTDMLRDFGKYTILYLGSLLKVDKNSSGEIE